MEFYELKPESKGMLLKRVFLKYSIIMVIMFIVLFFPAGSLAFWNGWLFLGALVIPSMSILIYLFFKDPALLEKRMKTKEKEKPQKIYLVSSLMVVFATFIIPGLDFKYQWSEVSTGVVIIFTGVMLIGYYMFFIVLKQNSYASRVVEIQHEQKLIDTGLYSLVRHPMYMAATILYISMPFVLGSYYAVIPSALIPVLLIIRIKNEEKVLLNGLKGYDIYMQKVRYRLIPFIW